MGVALRLVPLKSYLRGIRIQGKLKKVYAP
jgi:hypothetical protein